MTSRNALHAATGRMTERQWPAPSSDEDVRLFRRMYMEHGLLSHTFGRLLARLEAKELALREIHEELRWYHEEGPGRASKHIATVKAQEIAAKAGGVA